jgi:exodeoxyribonuclease V alpha subunit
LQILQDGNFPDIAWQQIPAGDMLARTMRPAVVNGFRSILQAGDPLEALSRLESFRLLCGLRKGPYGSAALNRLIEDILRREHLISPDKRWYRGRPVLILQNDYNLGLYNGDMGMILPDSADEGNLRAFFATPEGDLRKLIPVRLPQHETAYALTVHKAQGSEFDEVLLVLPDRSAPVLTRELIYTAVTRARERVTVWGSPEVLLEAVGRRTERSSGLRDALWES